MVSAGAGLGGGPPRGIVTPEAVLLEFETAGLASRSLAAAIDFAARVGMFLLLLFLFGLVFQALGTDSEWLAYALIFVGGLAILVGYSIVFECLWNGRTPGKAALSLRVVTTEGGPVRFRHAAVRSAVGLIDFYLVPFGVCATVSVVLSRRSQRLGDLAAGTIVLQQRSGVSDAMPIAFPPPPGLDAYVASLDVSAITEDQYGVLRGFLTRVFELSPEARGSLSVRLANPLAEAMRHTPPPGLHPEIFLAAVAAAYQRRHGGPAVWFPPRPPPPPPPYRP